MNRQGQTPDILAFLKSDTQLLSRAAKKPTQKCGFDTSSLSELAKQLSQVSRPLPQTSL
ncbi:MAG: hypothetical protein KDD60_09025 [Bdellovibrionales bacterium]|nr:hypothetical protein [Bdellovibrionales bacterium]